MANGKDVDEAMADYKATVGTKVKACLDSLNDGATIIGRGDYQYTKVRNDICIVQSVVNN